MTRLDRLRHLPLFVLFELAPDSWTAAALARLRQPLPRPGAEELGMLCAHDLARIAPAVSEAGVAFLGASFDPSELLRPGWPHFAALAEQYRLSLGGSGFGRRLLFLGAVDGALPDRRLQPDPQRPPSPWRLLPLALVAEDATIDRLSADLEQRLLDGGECAPPVLTALASWFGVQISHARHLTALDLLAIQRAQYLQADAEPLADLLEAALLSPERICVVQTEDGLLGAWDGQRVRLGWQPPLAGQPLVAWCGYSASLRRLQQGLSLHGIDSWMVEAGTSDSELLAAARLDDLQEELIDAAAVVRWELLEDPELGLLLVQGLDQQGRPCRRIYPLTAHGLVLLDERLGELPRSRRQIS